MFDIKKEILYEIKSHGYIQYYMPVQTIRTFLQSRLALTFDLYRLFKIFDQLLEDRYIIRKWDDSRKCFDGSIYFHYRLSKKGIEYLEG